MIRIYSTRVDSETQGTDISGANSIKGVFLFQRLMDSFQKWNEKYEFNFFQSFNRKFGIENELSLFFSFLWRKCPFSLA